MMINEKVENLRLELANRPVARHRLYHRAAERMAAQKTLLQEPGAVTSEFTSIVRRKRSCSCAAYKRESCMGIMGLLTIRSSMSSQHLPSCAFFKSTKQDHRRTLIFDLPLRWNIAGLSTTLKITRGADAYVLSRSLICRRIVPYNNPASQYLHEVFMEFSSRGNISTSDVEGIRNHLYAMFRKGEASPKDISCYGHSNLLYVS